MNATGLLAAIRARGSDAKTLRDAAHEAHHALVADVRTTWTRDHIHEALIAFCDERPGHLVTEELDARAVEQLVCQRLGVDCGAVDKWAAVCWFETVKSIGVALPSPAWIADLVRERMQQSAIVAAADRVLALYASRASTRRARLIEVLRARHVRRRTT